MTCASFRSSHCGAQGAVGDRSAAMRRANSRGVRYPRLLCGRSSLYSSLHAAIFLRASNRFPNQLAFKHSSRNFPWKLSTNAFCTGRPGSICTNSIFRSSAHARKCRLVNSGPLSQRIASGAPRSTTIFSSSRVTRRLGNPLSASSVKHSRVYTSITLNTRNFLPLSAASSSRATLRRSSGSHTAGSTPPRSTARRSAAGSPETCSTASALPPCVLRSPPVFFNHRFQHLLVQTQIRHQLLQPPVFIFQLSQPLRFSHAHPAVLGLPRVDGVLRYSQLPPHLRRAPARLHLLQCSDHLHFAILPLRHVFTSTHPPALLPGRKSYPSVRGKWGEGQTDRKPSGWRQRYPRHLLQQSEHHASVKHQSPSRPRVDRCVSRTCGGIRKNRRWKGRELRGRSQCGSSARDDSQRSTALLEAIQHRYRWTCKLSKSARGDHHQEMTMKIFKQVGLLALILFLAAQTGYARTLVVQKEISVSRALAGQVLLKGTDEPADGVTVELRSSDWKDVLASTKTDARGHFSIETPKTGKLFYIRVSAPGMDIYELRVRINKHSAQELAIRLSVAT